MSISYHAAMRSFHLTTPKSSYVIALTGGEGIPAHAYYGARVPDEDLSYLLGATAGQGPLSDTNGFRAFYLDALPTEYSGCNVGDFRQPCLAVRDAQGRTACHLTYVTHRIYPGKPSLEPLPATYGGEGDCTTLELECRDPYADIFVTLYYTAFEHIDAITRSARIRNASASRVFLDTALSACLDMENRNFDMITLHGRWTNERMIERVPLHMGRQSVFSLRGISSHQENPFIALCEQSATQRQGEVYAMNFVYSGNFLAQVEVDQQRSLRMVMGIHPDRFSWVLDPENTFQTPEAVLVWSGEGLGGMTRAFHDLYRKHLVRGPWRDAPRPSLVNNWEGTYFDFDEEKLLTIAREAADRGIEMFVLDDGWFGHRNDDTSSLGDWFVNPEKLPDGIAGLSKKIHAMGLRFGLWLEPEMVSPDSELYRAHPDYALDLDGRPAALYRNQLVLDITREDVRDCIYGQIKKVLDGAQVDYIKWDMNRPLSDVMSRALDADHQGEVYHRYVLGVYDLQARLLRDFPDLLLENCCSGGGRFDPGMLYFSPQIWTSDNTEAIDRLSIQEGTALVYPYACMGAHVSVCPNHAVGRTTPFETRANVALAGAFGYELDLTRLDEADKAAIPRQIEFYHRYGSVFRTGDYYRIASLRENRHMDVSQFVSKDRTVAIVIYVSVTNNFFGRTDLVRLEGLDPNRRYRSNLDGSIRSGAVLMNAGLLLPQMMGDFNSRRIVLEAVD